MRWSKTKTTHRFEVTWLLRNDSFIAASASGNFLRLFDKNANFYMDEASDGLKKLASSMGDFSITTNSASSLLAQEIESRNEMLHALVKDKNDTPV